MPDCAHCCATEDTRVQDQDRQPPTTESSLDVTADDLFRRIADIINAARGSVARVVNSAMVQAYWEIGRQIVEVEQQGDQRAGYGEQVLAGLSERLTRCFGRGFSLPLLRRIRQFYQVYPASAHQAPDAVDIDTQQIGAALRSELLSTAQPQFRQELGWTHYRLLMTIANANRVHSTRPKPPAKAGLAVNSSARSLPTFTSAWPPAATRMLSSRSPTKARKSSLHRTS